MQKIVSIDEVLNRDGYLTELAPQDIKCPICAFEYQSAGTPVVEPGNDAYEASWEGRGDLLIIPFLCEDGHKWELCFGFHKGMTGVFVRYEEGQPS